MLSDSQLEELFRTAGVLRDGTHVVLPSGLHSPGFFNQLPLLGEASYQQLIAQALVERLVGFEKRTGRRVRAIVGLFPKGGLWSYPVQKQLWQKDPMREVGIAMTRQNGDRQIFRVDPDSGHNDSDSVRGRQVAIVNDIVTTGESNGQVSEAIYRVGGEPLVVLTLCDRRALGGTDELEVLSLVKINWPLWTPADCPLCPDTPINLDFGQARNIPTCLG